MNLEIFEIMKSTQNNQPENTDILVNKGKNNFSGMNLITEHTQNEYFIKSNNNKFNKIYRLAREPEEKPSKLIEKPIEKPRFYQDQGHDSNIINPFENEIVDYSHKELKEKKDPQKDPILIKYEENIPTCVSASK